VIGRVVIGADRWSRDGVDGVTAQGRDRGVDRAVKVANRAGRAAAQIDLKVGRLRRGGGGLPVLQRPLLLGPVDLTEIVDARVGLGYLARRDEVGNGDGRQQTDDRNDD